MLRLLAGSHQATLSGVHPVASSGVITLSIPHPSQATDPSTALQGPQEDRPREARLPAMPSLSLRLEQTPNATGNSQAFVHGLCWSCFLPSGKPNPDRLRRGSVLKRCLS